jgi:uncharacterized protein YutE (UPF0331/DUF86 family)
VVDRDLVLRRAADIDQYLQQLAEYAHIELDAYKADWKVQRVVERTLHLVIETCMDLADHIVADRRLGVPETAGATFDILARADVISPELGATLARMVGFRNILVHDYTRLDPTIVLNVLRTNLVDVERFRDAIIAAI